jgi:S1-C subfamily serine protease
VAGIAALGAVAVHGGVADNLPGFGSNGSSASGTAASSSAATDYDRGVVNINAVLGGQNATAAGTGMILDADGTVLTNNHVVSDATSITATDVNTGKRYSAAIVGTDASDDIAVIQLRNASGLTPITIGDSSTVRVGQQVVAIGNAGGRGGTPTVVNGKVTALAQTITATDSDGSSAETLSGLIQTDAPIVAGDSGGPLTTSDGKVIGIDTAASANGQTRSPFGSGSGSGFGSGGFSRRGGTTSGANEGYAIPIAKAMTIAKQIESGSSDSNSGSSGSSSASDRGYLGVEVTDGSTGNTGVAGAEVDGTVIGSPAEAAGLGEGDVITALNGQSVSSAADLSQLLAGTKAGQQVTVTWTAGSGSSSATITLMSGSST